jgi:heme-degrading monooxygenase HmoA
MNVIPTDHGGVLIINIFSVRPENQQALVECMREGVPSDMPGLLSTHLLRSRDGTKVINHMLWESEEAFRQAVRDNPTIAATRRRVHELIENAAPDAYEVIDIRRPARD